MRPDPHRPKRRAWPLLCLLIPFAAGAVTPADYAYRFTLNTPGSSAAWRVELTPAVYAASRRDANLRDLVVVNAQGQQVPFAPLPEAPPRPRPFSMQATLLPLPASSTNSGAGVRVHRNSHGDIVIEQPSTPVASGRPSQWLLDAHRRVALDRIDIDPAALPADARFHLSVQASDDLQSWSERGQGSDIVSVKRGVEAVEQHTITLSGGAPARYFRLSLRPDDVAPWNSAQTPRVELRGSYSDPLERIAARHWLTLSAAPASAASGGGVNYDYALPAALPLEAARIALAGDNTVARFSLLDHDGGSERMLAMITAVRIEADEGDDPSTAFATVRVQHLRLHTDTPLSRPPSLRVAWQPDVFVFLAEGDGPYSLLAGSYVARRGDYPVDAALERIRPRGAAGTPWQPPLAMLGGVSDAAGASALLAPKTPYDWSRPLLWLVLIGGALLVAGMAWSLLRQARRTGDKR